MNSLGLCFLFVILSIPYKWTTVQDLRIPGENKIQEILINRNGSSIVTRFTSPQGYERATFNTNTFANYLQNLPLKPHGSKVLLFDGSVKPEDKIYCAVIDMKIGRKDLQQCADAIIRLRAEYLYEKGQIDKIHFNFTNGEKADFAKYAEGYRVQINNEKVIWSKKAEKNYSYKTLSNYLEMVFMYAGSYSLSQELEPVTNPEKIQIGDVFIKGGFPGHAVIVVDIVINQVTKEKKFLLAQSYMPAQEIQVLINPVNNTPWFEISTPGKLLTPEWIFEFDELKRFHGE